MDKKIMLSKEEFVKYLNDIVIGIQKRDDFNQALRNVCDGHPVIEIGSEWLNASVSMLSIMMGDKPDQYGTMIEWWLYEYNNHEKVVYVKEPKHGDNTVKISVATPEELYDYLANR